MSLPSLLTGAVARQQGIAVEARGAALAVGPSGVAQAATAGACQWVAVAEEHVGVTVSATVTGLARAAQHQGVPKEAGCTPGVGGAGPVGGAGSGTQCPGPLKQTLPHSGTAAQLTARKRRQRSRVCRDTGCGHLAGCSLSRSCKDGSGHHTLAFSGQAPVYLGWARHQVLGSHLMGPPGCNGLHRGQC